MTVTWYQLRIIGCQQVVSVRLLCQTILLLFACLFAWLILIVVLIFLSFQFSWRLKSHSTRDATSGLNFSK